MINENAISMQPITEEWMNTHNVELHMKREDELHADISGNKWRKLKYNILAASEKEYDRILTFGGAYSNHIAATAAAGKEFGFKTYGVIRGEPHYPLNPTLALAVDAGMHLHYLSRSKYNEKNSPELIEELRDLFGDFYLLPEGGSNALAVRGCNEILSPDCEGYDLICVPVGTGGTLAGVVSGLNPGQKALGFSALKGGEFLTGEVEGLIKSYKRIFGLENSESWEINFNAHRGGFAKVDDELVSFVRRFFSKHEIPLDLIYTGKMMMKLMELMKSGQFQNKKILAIHTGGLQGNHGFEERLGIELF